MAQVDIACNEIADAQGVHLQIEVEVPGWTERIAVPAPARPGAVQAAVAKIFRSLGLAAEPVR